MASKRLNSDTICILSRRPLTERRYFFYFFGVTTMLSKPNPASTTLYSAPQELESHTVRFIMAHKSIEREVLELKFERNA